MRRTVSVSFVALTCCSEAFLIFHSKQQQHHHYNACYQRPTEKGTSGAFTPSQHHQRFIICQHSSMQDASTLQQVSIEEEEPTSTIPIDHILNAFPGASVVLPGPSPILELPNFLSNLECERLRDWATDAIEKGAPECDDYLNYRVNQEIETSGTSNESKELLADRYSHNAKLQSTDSGGFRIKLDESIVENLLKHRLTSLLQKSSSTELLFQEGLWHKPTPRTVIVRDQTIVRYAPGDGVPPHVDGKDGTLLVYLNDVPHGAGGRTVFPDHDFAQSPVEGTALFYRSKEELVHYSEAMINGPAATYGTTSCHQPTKWILQLLLDFDHEYKPGDRITDFRTGESYVWDGAE